MFTPRDYPRDGSPTGAVHGETTAERRPGHIATFAAAFCAIAVCVLCVWYASHNLRTMFRYYDDEGYMLLQLKYSLGGAQLYTETYTQYGPFYFFAQEFCFRLLNLPVTHDSGRLITLGYWLLSALLMAGAFYRFRRDLLLASSVFAACTALAVVLRNEPGHPQQVVLILFGAAVFLAAWAPPRWTGIALFLIGAIGSALAFTKINIGIFFLLALAHTLACLLPRCRFRSLGVGLMLLASLTVPYLLVRPNLATLGAYCVVATLCASVTFACGAVLKPGMPIRPGSVLWALAGALAAGTGIVLGAVSRGVSLSTLITGVILDPAKHSSVLFVPLRFHPVEVPWVVLTIGCTGALTWLAHRGRLAAFENWVGALRCVAGVCAIPLLLVGGVAWVLPMVPLVLIPVRPEPRQWFDWFPRLFIANLAVMQFLQTYPVAASQVKIASLPALLCAMLCIYDGAGGLHSILGRFKPARRETVVRGLAVLVIGIVAAKGWFLDVRPLGFGYPRSQLRGSAMLAIEYPLEARYRFIADRVAANCDVLFTMPGMGSFNFWSGVAPPNGSNMTGWIQSFTIERQNRILQLLRARPRACAVYNEELLKFWRTSDRAVAASPLAQYILHDMVKVAERDGYEIRIQPWRTTPWIE